jgi:hypothetical protein
MGERMKLFALAVLAAGCSLQSEGLGTDSPDLTDKVDSSVAPDTALQEASIVDSTPIDSGVDTSVPDTSMPETSVPDTSMPDTKPIDTGPPDVGPETPGPTLSVMTSTLATFNVNLSDGARDWAHWGHPATDSFNRKSGGMMITKGTRTAVSTFESLVYHFAWSGGDPTPTMADTKRGLKLDTVGNAVTFEVSGDPSSERTLDVWASATGGATVVTGTLSDAATGSVATTLTAGVYLVTFKYRTASMSGKLKVEIKRTEAGAVDAYSAFFAAAVR